MVHVVGLAVVVVVRVVEEAGEVNVDRERAGVEQDGSDGDGWMGEKTREVWMECVDREEHKKRGSRGSRAGGGSGEFICVWIDRWEEGQGMCG